MAEPSRLTPPAAETPLREIPGLRKRERTWKDEVRERVAARQRMRSKERDQTDASSAPEMFVEMPPRRTEALAPERPRPRIEIPPLVTQRLPQPEAEPAAAAPPPLAEEPVRGNDPLSDLPLFEPEPEQGPEVEAEAEAPKIVEPFDETGTLVGESDDEEEWELDPAPPARPTSSVERPAQPGERALAALVDASLLGGLYCVVVYFASRAAQTSPGALFPAWPWLAAYLALLGLAYAGCFTGITGQTPGKMWAGLRVVDGAGRAPGVWTATLRAAAALVGMGLAGAGLVPVLVDPARRALHDRLLGTRVVHR